jgi:transposase
MQEIVKHVCGIDVSQKELVVYLGRMYNDLSVEVYAHRSVINQSKGFESLMNWVTGQTLSTVEVRYVMEATGVYHEKIAYYLHENNQAVSIVLPNKISNYFRTLDIKTLTDKTASAAITQFGLERTLDKWNPPCALYKQLRQPERERDRLVQSRTVIKNQLHAEQSEVQPHQGTEGRLKKKNQSFIGGQIKEIMAEIDGKQKQDVAILTSIPGTGILTAVSVLSETNGFELIRNKRQLSSYAGLDVRESNREHR